MYLTVFYFQIDNKSGPSATLMDAKAIHATNKTFLFGSRFSSDARHVIAGVEHYLHVWDSRSGSHLSTLTLHSVYKYPLSVSTKANLIATGSLIHTAIKVYYSHILLIYVSILCITCFSRILLTC